MNIGSVISFIFKFFNFSLIFLFKELSLIQPSLPPNSEVSELLYNKAALLKLLLEISSLISFNFLFNKFLLFADITISESKYDFSPLLKVSSICFFKEFLSIFTLDENF